MSTICKVVILFVSLISIASGRQRAQGWCEKGGSVVVTSGVQSTTKVQQSFPGCTVTVYLTGTTTLATLYSDNSGTSKPNPFTADSNGHWYWYADNARYDVRLSGGGLAAPFTIGDVLLADPSSSSINTVPGGGTGVSSITGVIIGAGTSPFTGVAASSQGQHLRRKYNVTGTQYEFSDLPIINAADYNWISAQNQTITVPGTYVFTVTPCPLGFSTTNYYVALTGGVGIAEGGLVGAGSTCTSGAASGTIEVTLANAHSGNYILGSVAAGIPESIAAAGGSRVNVRLPDSTLQTYAPVTVTGENVFIYGEGQATIISPQFTTGPVFHFSAIGNGSGGPVGFRNGIRNFRIEGPNNSNTLTGVEIRGQLLFRASDVQITKALRGFYINDTSGAVSSAVWIRQCFVEMNVANGSAIEQMGGADIFLLNNHLTSDTSLSGTTGIKLIYSLGSKIMYNEVFGFGYGLLMSPGSGQYVSAIESIGNWYDSAQVDAWRMAPDAAALISEIRSIGDRMSASVENGISILGTSSNIIGVVFSSDLVSFNHGTGIYYGGGMDVEFNGCHVYGNSYLSAGTYHGFTASAGASNFRIHGGTYAASAPLPGGGVPNTQGYGILVSVGASNNYIIEGAVVTPNVTGAVSDGGTGPTRVIRNNLGLQNGLPTVSVTSNTLNLGTQPYESVLVTGTETVNDIVPAYAGRRVNILKSDAGTVTFNATATIHNAQTLGTNEAIIAEFVNTKWVLTK